MISEHIYLRLSGKLTLEGITHSLYRRGSSASRGERVVTPYESLMPSEITLDYAMRLTTSNRDLSDLKGRLTR